MQSTRQPERTDVAIVGAGPTGLVAAVRWLSSASRTSCSMRDPGRR
jgi:cation diffusion facilitator CzcD-associated flavoprotein CzcO